MGNYILATKWNVEMRRISAVLLPLIIVWCESVPADEVCGLDAARIRNSSEVTCHHNYGPKSDVWNGIDEQPLRSCLSEVQREYAIAVEACNPNPPPSDGFAQVEPRKGTLAGGVALALIVLML